MDANMKALEKKSWFAQIHYDYLLYLDEEKGRRKKTADCRFGVSASSPTTCHHQSLFLQC